MYPKGEIQPSKYTVKIRYTVQKGYKIAIKNISTPCAVRINIDEINRKYKNIIENNAIFCELK
ncbi:hypothetical protein [Treponema pectinovorum]|uniref:hypothetical protein n=1 Tax=Treponema pectinovorum TaxID=164 RepID=UPI003D946B67